MPIVVVMTGLSGRQASSRDEAYTAILDRAATADFNLTHLGPPAATSPMRLPNELASPPGSIPLRLPKASENQAPQAKALTEQQLTTVADGYASSFNYRFGQ